MDWGVYTVLLWEILPSVNICRKQIQNAFFKKMRHFCTAKKVANQEKVTSFLDSATSN